MDRIKINYFPTISELSYSNSKNLGCSSILVSTQICLMLLVILWICACISVFTSLCFRPYFWFPHFRCCPKHNVRINEIKMDKNCQLNISNDWDSLCSTAIKSVKWNSIQHFSLFAFDCLYICQRRWYGKWMFAPDAVDSVHVMLRQIAKATCSTSSLVS